MREVKKSQLSQFFQKNNRVSLTTPTGKYIILYKNYFIKVLKDKVQIFLLLLKSQERSTDPEDGCKMVCLVGK